MTLEHTIKKPVDFIYDYLTDMQKFVSVHPVIYRIDNVSENKYLIFEKLGFGALKASFTYYATLNSNAETKSVEMTAKVMKMVSIEMKYQLSSDGDNTKVKEDIQFKSFLPLKAIMKQIFKKQHQQLFLNIENTN